MNAPLHTRSDDGLKMEFRGAACHVLAEASGIDLTDSLGSNPQTIFTATSARIPIVTAVGWRPTSYSGVETAALLSVKTYTSGLSLKGTIMFAQRLGLPSIVGGLQLIPVAGAVVMPSTAGDVICYTIETASNATTHTGTLYLLGFYL